MTHTRAVKVNGELPLEWPWDGKCDYLWELLQKNVGMSNAYDLGSKVLFNANVVKKLDECGGTKFGIDINSKTLESPELMSPSLGRILNNAHSSSYIYVAKGSPPPNIP